jgi:mannose-6-phosphate isomerase-like protein (cupin superfamily)
MKVRGITLIGLTLLVVTIAITQTSGTTPQEPSSVMYFSKQQVDAGFAKGGDLFPAQSNYRVMTLHREGSGESEIHTLDTDVFYVVKGSAVFITGGKAIGAKQTAPNELRGKSIEGGTAHRLSQGDIIVIPHGVPHWFKEVQPPFQYLTIKVR